MDNVEIHADLIGGLPGCTYESQYNDLMTLILMEPSEIQLRLGIEKDIIQVKGDVTIPKDIDDLISKYQPQEIYYSSLEYNERGNFYDRNNISLTANLRMYDIGVMPKKIHEKNKFIKKFK